MPPPRPPYNGAFRKLVLAFDIGTTYSGISYSILDPGQVPEIKGVTRYPAQEKVGGDSKIPTIIYYDKSGKVRAVGAEAMRESLRDTIEDEGWIKASWFKLHMRLQDLSEDDRRAVPPRPPNKSVIQLFSDFMRYLYACAKTYIQEAHVNGARLWSSFESSIEFVLTHPNGWGGPEQQKMRQAAVLAGLIPGTDGGHARIHFVTEGEASLHFCIQKGLTTEPLKNGGGILIVDAGGGTIDLSAYGQTTTPKGVSFEEITVTQCHMKGSVFVTSRARNFLEGYLRGSKFANDVDVMTESFDKTSKLAFEKAANPLFIRFGGARDRDPDLHIRGGQLRLLGSDVVKFFEPSASCIIRAIREQCDSSRKVISSVFLVGGFSASEWLFSELKEKLGAKLDICRPDSHVNKAVADGATSFYLDRYVKVRVSSFVYGTDCVSLYRPEDPEHKARSHRVVESLDGLPRLPHFSIILPKNVQVSETQEFRESYVRTAEVRMNLTHVSDSIIAYRGATEYPRWMDVDPTMYSTLCYVEADTTELSKTLQLNHSPNRRPYYRMQYDIILSFGLTERKAQVCWMEKGEEKRGPAKIVYDLDDERA